MPKPQTNVQFVKSIMEVSKYGPLAQLFVLDALDKWSKLISETDPAKVDNALISGEAWVGVAKEIHQKLAERM
jgi:hypothetical protein